MPLDPMFSSSAKARPVRPYTTEDAQLRRHTESTAYGRGHRAWYFNVYLASEHWANLRARKLKRNPRCELCKCEPATQVHHLRYRCIFDVLLTDLQCLCWRCHASVHGIGKARRRGRHSGKARAERKAKIERQQFRPQRKPARWLTPEQYQDRSKKILDQ